MIKHFIIMSSSYTDGVRIALDITEDKSFNKESIHKIIQGIKQKCGKGVPLSMHFIETKSDRWDSVAEYDPFFEGVRCIESVEEFIEKIKKDRILSGLDVADYILSKIKCTHLSLEKLIYFSYADYLCGYSGRLFEDRIFAFTHGPVIDSVYKAYKKNGYQYVKPLEFGADSDIKTKIEKAPIKSRILFAIDGIDKMYSIDQTIEKYGKYTAGQLVGFTHRKGSPWSHVDSSIPYQIITDDLIKMYHHVECV